MAIDPLPVPVLPAASRFVRAWRALARMVRGGVATRREALRTTVAILRAQQDATIDGTSLESSSSPVTW